MAIPISKTLPLLAMITLGCLGGIGLKSALASEKIHFPDHFKWCVSTSAHQIEGNNIHNDWWQWEQKPGHFKSNRASDHWNRVHEDIRLIQKLHADSYRFSIEWSRIEPREGALDFTAIQHYRHEVKALIQAGITPILTLQHFTFPLWVREKGGWEWDGIADAMGRFAQLVYSEIAPEVQYWVTINEPMNYILGGYIAGAVPPGEKRKLQEVVPVLRGLLKSHAQVYQVLHQLAETKSHPSGQEIYVGMALQLREMKPWNSWSLFDLIATPAARTAFNWTLPDAMTSGRLRMNLWTQVNADEMIPDLAHTQDFIGINFYGGDFVEFSLKKGLVEHNWDDSPENSLETDLRPKSFYTLVKEAASRYPGKPLLILENGIDDPSDSKRPQSIKSHLKYLSKAIQEGAPVLGYCHWTLMDTFEWLPGFKSRFGLYEVDYTTFERTPRSSADLFRRIADQNGFEE